MLLGQRLGVPHCDRNSFVGKPGPDPRPRDLEPKLAVLEIDPGSSVVNRLRLTVDVATPPPMRIARRFHDPAYRQATPN